MITIRELKAFHLFHGLKNDELSRILPLCRERSLEKGAVCCLQGAPANELYLCRNGRVDIVVKHFEAPTVHVLIHSVLKGEAFGWSALAAPYRYTASAICAENTDEICLRRTSLLKLFDQCPRTGYVFMRNLAALISCRLTEYSKRLSRDAALDAREDYEW